MGTTDSILVSPAKTAAYAIAVAAAYFVAAVLALELTEGIGGTATIWPASGVFVSALLLARPGQTPFLAGAVAVASFAANALYGASVGASLAFTVANLAEALFVSQLILRTCGIPKRMDDRQWLVTFLAATIGGSAIGAFLATVMAGGLGTPFFISWFTTVCLGNLIVTPLVLSLAIGFRRRKRPGVRQDLAQLALVSGVVTVLAVVAFTFGEGRFLFLPVIGLIAATYFHGSRGLAVCIGLVAFVAVMQTDFDQPISGPLGLNSETLFLQFYLLSLLCAAWPLAALISEKAELLDDYAQNNTYLKLAESTAKLGHWYLSADNSELVWSEEVYRIHGVGPDHFRSEQPNSIESLDSFALYHPDDRERVRETLMVAMQYCRGFNYDARIVRPDGEIRHVSSVGKPRFAEDGTFEGLFGTFQDVTEQNETLAALYSARALALSEADKAKRLAETDELTGIPNRRKAIADLRAIARVAGRAKEPLTIAIFDIDHFKSVNDRYGHSVGDRVLERVCRIVEETLDGVGMVGRLGGEEFLVAIPETDASSGAELVDAIRSAIQSEPWERLGPASLTISAGIASLEGHEDTADLMQRADEALYAAKARGRNCLHRAA